VLRFTENNHKEKGLNATGLLGFIFAALLAGVAVPIQTGLNTQLGKALGSPFLASLISFTAGTLAVLGVVLVNQTGLPPLSRLSGLPWWVYTGGLFGAFFITCAILLAPRLGATTMLGLFVTGQMLASLALDHYGALGFPQHPVSWFRFIGVALVIAGVFVIQRF